MLDPRVILERLRSETDSMVAETARLVSIDSGRDAPDGIARVGELVGELLARPGFIARPGVGGGLSATLVLGSGPKLVVIGHADTVWPIGTSADWPPRRDGDMLTGPGVGDMKGCLVMAAHALATAYHAGLDGIGEIEVLVVADEELGSVGSRGWIEDRVRGAAACLGLEAGWPGGGVVVARGAVGALKLEAFGRSAHCAGHEDRGASAVSALAPLVAGLEGLSRPDEGMLVNVGIFRGGVARQVVPDAAELVIDVRSPTAERAAELLAEVEAMVERASRGDVRLELSGGITRPAFARSASDDLFAVAGRQAQQLCLALEPVSSRGGSDASFAAALGVPTLDGLGPICHDSCARGERIEIESLAARAALMALLLLDLAQGWRDQARDSGKVDAPA